MARRPALGLPGRGGRLREDSVTFLLHEWNELTSLLVILLGEWDRSTKLEDGCGKEKGDGWQICFRVVGQVDTGGVT